MKKQILNLRNQGKSFREIEKILGCSKATISYHCSEGQKNKAIARNKKLRSKKPLLRNIESYKNRKAFATKTRDFGRRKGKELNEKSECNFNYEDVLNKFGENPICYLTGDSIDFNKVKSYAFDHIIPVSKGGKNTLNNLGLCTKRANMSKTDMTLEEYLFHCQKVLEHHGYTVKERIN